MKFENNNKEVIKKITNRSLKSNKIRNIFVIVAIVLTTFMISSVFSIGLNFAKNYNTMNLRLQGSTTTITLQNPTDNQFNKIKDLGLFNSVGKEINVGKVSLEDLAKNKTKIVIKYYDKESFKKQITPCISNIKGNYPQKENEVMMSKKALDFLGESKIKIGDKINISYKIGSKIYNKEFILSGYYTDYSVMEDTGYMLVSKKFIKYNKLDLNSNTTILIDLKSKYKNSAQDILNKEIKLNSNQKFSYNYDISQDLRGTLLSTIAVVLIMVLFIILSGYLLIYNVVYIGVNRDINFYGLLKTIGTSPKQIKEIVRGQVLRLSLIGIPIGLILGLIVSFGIVPITMSTIFAGTQASAMPRDVSFNPIIFILATLFSLLTVMISCKKPAKIAGNISPTEALRYTGITSKKTKKSRKSTKGGKLYKMAWYNVFREKKRAFVVFLSLFMGIITFLSVNTFLSSISVENYISNYVKNDFTIQNIGNVDDKIDEQFIKEIKNIKGVKNINISKASNLRVDMNDDIILPALKSIYERYNTGDEELNKYLESIKKDPALLKASVVGVDDNLIDKLNDSLKNKIDAKRFKKGKMALVDSWYYNTDVYKKINGDLTIRNSKLNTSSTFNTLMIDDNKQLLPSDLPAPLGIPTIYISNEALEKIDKNANINLLYINVDKKYEVAINSKLKRMSDKRGLSFESRIESTAEFKKSQMVMNILGGGIGVILILIGILNFINIMITGVNSRLNELAVLESIGMTKKQIKKMLTFEGLYYALITTGFILTIGMAIICVISELTKNIADYAQFTFPTLSLTFLIIIIFAVCLITPSLVFKVSSKQSITERIREIEK